MEQLWGILELKKILIPRASETLPLGVSSWRFILSFNITPLREES